MTDYLIPMILLLASALSLGKKENSYSLLLEGGAEGLRLLKDILPTLVLLLTAVELFRASGAAELLQALCGPLFALFGIPAECALLVLVRPISGSAALAVGTSLMQTYGVNSQIGRTAAVMLGSTETTFYTISVYFGAAGIPCPPPFLPIWWASPQRPGPQNCFSRDTKRAQRRSIQKTWTERLLRIIAPFERCPPVVAAGQRSCHPQ